MINDLGRVSTDDCCCSVVRGNVGKSAHDVNALAERASSELHHVQDRWGGAGLGG